MDPLGKEPAGHSLATAPGREVAHLPLLAPFPMPYPSGVDPRPGRPCGRGASSPCPRLSRKGPRQRYRNENGVSRRTAPLVVGGRLRSAEPLTAVSPALATGRTPWHARTLPPAERENPL